jgi:hypothetical protein
MSDAPETPLPPVPTFPPSEKVCGNCKLWQPHSIDHRGWVGPCRVQPNRGLFPPTAPICDAFAPRGQAAVLKEVERPRERVARSVAPVVRKPHHAPEESVDLLGDASMTRQELMDLFREAAGDADAPPLAGKWEGGMVQILPGNKELQGKEVSIDSLFHKVVMIRDRLRTLEQKVNAHPKLTDAEKVELQHYVTRCYGSLTTFNVLFKDKGDQFVGSKED